MGGVLYSNYHFQKYAQRKRRIGTFKSFHKMIRVFNYIFLIHQAVLSFIVLLENKPLIAKKSLDIQSQALVLLCTVVNDIV